MKSAKPNLIILLRYFFDSQKSESPRYTKKLANVTFCYYVGAIRLGEQIFSQALISNIERVGYPGEDNVPKAFFMPAFPANGGRA